MYQKANLKYFTDVYYQISHNSSLGDDTSIAVIIVRLENLKFLITMKELQIGAREGWLWSLHDEMI